MGLVEANLDRHQGFDLRNLACLPLVDPFLGGFLDKNGVDRVDLPSDSSSSMVDHKRDTETDIV